MPLPRGRRHNKYLWIHITESAASNVLQKAGSHHTCIVARGTNHRDDEGAHLAGCDCDTINTGPLPTAGYNAIDRHQECGSTSCCRATCRTRSSGWPRSCLPAVFKTAFFYIENATTSSRSHEMTLLAKTTPLRCLKTVSNSNRSRIVVVTNA